MASSTPRAQRFAAVWTALEEHLDWELLGRLHCSEGGEDFFGAADREALLDAGLSFADDLARELRPGGSSLYVGASVAELVPMLVEALVLGRRVHWFERDTAVVRELGRGLREVGLELGASLPRPRIDPLSGLPAGSCDHLWLVSVLSDPDTFPALHDRLYGRSGDASAGPGDLPAERRRARRLVHTALQRLAPPALLSTTDEELPLVAPLVRAWGRRLEIPDRARLSAVVGDPVRHCRVR